MLDLIKFVKEVAEMLMGMEAAKREKIAKYLDEIAVLIDEFPPLVREGKPASDLQKKASQTLEIAKEFKKTTLGVLGEEKASMLSTHLGTAVHHKEFFSSAPSDMPRREELLKELGDAAGTFRGAATNLRAQT